jgi:hypothetical protein
VREVLCAAPLPTFFRLRRADDDKRRKTAGYIFNKISI